MSNDLQSGQNNNPNLSPADVPPWVRYLADSSARLVFKYGVEMESSMMTSYARNPDYSFFRSSDRYHAYYKKKLAEYRAQKHEGPEIKYSDYGIADTPLRVKVREPFRKPPEFLAYLPESFSYKMKRPPPPPRKYAAILPKWITGKELETIKATAKSVARHGQVLNLVKEGNMDEPQYQFMIPGDWRYLYFNNLVDAYRHDNLRTAELVASESEVAAYEESFQRFFEEKKKLHEGAELAVIDSHENVWMLLLKPPKSEGSEPKRQRCFDESEGSEPKRQRCFDESALVPEDQFLAEHPGLSTISVLVPDFDDWRAIEITVESLSENVASLKEKIAAEIQIPANRLRLIGKDGSFLMDQEKSLAHYNVGHKGIVTLSLSL